MNKKAMQPENKKEIKERIPVWMYPSTLAAIDKAMQQANCRSRSEFLEEAAQYYAGYISAENAIHYLPAMLVSAFQATVELSEMHISRLLFKLAVEMDMVMNVLAAGMEIGEDDLERLRGRCVQNVKKTSGGITFKDAVRYQNGQD